MQCLLPQWVVAAELPRVEMAPDSASNRSPGGGLHNPSPGIVADEKISQALVRIHECPDISWTVAQLAEVVGLSRSAFAARFVDVVGQPPMEYLRQLCLTEARHLLLDPELGLKEIAARIGYKTASAFSVAFKRATSLSPREFRLTASET